MYRKIKENIKRRLQETVKGEVSVHIYEDELIIDIYTDGLGNWHYTIDNLTVKLMAGVTSLRIVNEVIKHYETFIYYRYFRKK